MDIQTLAIDGVPEHFNLPWRWLCEHAALSGLGVELNWTDIPEGTGRMIERLSVGESDLALLLTEGAVAGIARGAPYRVLGSFVASPLQWGVHVSAKSALTSPADLDGGRFAISRYGSGSHLMAGVYAQVRGWSAKDLDYVVVDNIDGARQALGQGDAEIFLWEKFTTQPYVDRGEFRCVDVIPTPWPAFVACISETALAEKGRAADLAFHAARYAAERLRTMPDAAQVFARRYGLRDDAAHLWLEQTRWSRDGHIGRDILEQTANTLKSVGMIDTLPEVSRILAGDSAD